jgi:membrane protein involved in colicin uptake
LTSTGPGDAPTPPSDPKPAGFPHAAGHGQPLSQGTSRERGRLTLALLLSLLIHTLLLSLTFGDLGLGLPGFGFPWQDRRIEAPDLHLVLVPAQVPAAEPAVTPPTEPSQQARIEQPVASGPALAPSVPRAPSAGQTKAAIVPQANPRTEGNPRIDTRTGTAPAKTRLRGDRTGDMARRPIPEPAVIAVPRSDEATPVVPAAPVMPAPAIATPPNPSSPETAMPSPRDAADAAPARIDQEASERAVELVKPDPSRQERQQQAEQQEAARQDAARQEAARAENARLEAERQEAAGQAAALQETARQVADRQEAARAENARVEAERQEAARQAAALEETARQVATRQDAALQEAARAEAARVEAARVEAAQVEAARVEAARAEAARAEAARAEAARAEAARAEAARAEAARVDEAAARREEARRAIGRQLDEEAARRDAATSTARRSPSSSGVRRYRLFGRTDPSAEIILYAEAWSRKIQLNMTFDMVREAAKQPHTDPLVTVAIRSDGSVESVTFVQSSGVAAIDDAIRRIVHSQTPYQAFPAGLASEYDVIEIRRTWYFDMAIRLY